MEKETIKANDLRFRQKVEELRVHLASRQRTYARQRKIGLYLTVLGALVMVTAVGAYFLGNLVVRDQATPLVTSAQHAVATAPPEAPISVQSPTPARETAAGVSLTPAQAPPAAPLTEVPTAVAAPAPAAEVEPASPAVEPPVSAPAAPSLPTPVPSTPPLRSPETAVVARGEPAPPAPALPRADFRIARSLACLGVAARQCLGPQNVFALHEHNVPHVWMIVYSHKLPYVLTHVYYHEGRRYTEVPLAITYRRMRTWSRVTLQSPTQMGSWRVDIITDDGTVIDQVAFRVTP
jgi:hypothetical protein